MTENNKKELGAFYTPQHTVDYIVSLLGDFNNNSKLLEPSGGDGIFVSTILNKNLLKPNQIIVWDINPKTKKNINKLKIKNVIIKDTLLNTNLSDNSLFRKSVFTHIIGNPPYLNKQSSYIKQNKNKLKKIYKEIGANDTYAMFMYLGCKLLDNNGQFCFIISDTFLTLGIHKKLRKFLLENYQIRNITLCPSKLFKEMGALVNTCIIFIENKKPKNNTFIKINDCRNNKIGNYVGKNTKTNQLKFLDYPDYVFDFNGGSKILEKLNGYKKMIDFLDGGLGMHTTNNKKYLAVIDYNGKKYGNNSVTNIISYKKINGVSWHFYHKKGGNAKYYSPIEYAIKWDEKSKSNYKSYKKLMMFKERQGFIISGISSNLSARIAKNGALWESNKAMGFFPKEPKKYSPEFFIGLLNSDSYNKIIKLLNHTSSIQIRDIKKLPFFDFTKIDIVKITNFVKKIINNKRINLEYDSNNEQKKIDLIVSKYICS